MKTMSSKLRKAGMETIAITAVLFATCVTINAQGAKFETNEFKGTTLALAETGIKMTSADVSTEAGAKMAALATYLIEEKVAELETEEWMLNIDNFFMEYSLEEATEAELELKSWMVDESNFESFFNLEPATDEALEMEAWMLEDNLFNKKGKSKTKEKTETEKEGEVLAEVNTKTKKKAVSVTNQKTQFGRRAMILVEDEDPKLKMEQWMLDYRHWNLK